MRQPIQAMAANLAWTSAGTVWANYLIEGLPYGLRPTKDKKIVRQLHQALIRALPGESLLLGVRSTLDPAVIVSQMLTDVDLDLCPDWLEECEATLESLDQLGPGQRIYWLAVPLGADRVWDRVVVPARAALSGLKDQLGLPRTQIPAEEISHRLIQAARIQESIPAPFKAEPTTVAQRAWLHRHMLRRGLLEDMDLPSAGEVAAEEALLPRSGAVLTEPVLDEGGQSDLVDASAAGHAQANSRDSATGRAIGHAGTLLGELAGRVSPMRRRYLKVTDTSEVEGPVSSYQTLMVVSSVPENGSVFPGAEILGRLDESGVPGDWAMRLTTRSSASVAATNQRALQRLNEQFVQLDGEVTHSLSQLDRIGRDLGEYAQILANDSLEVETQPTLVFAVGGATPEESRQQAAALAGFMADTGYKVTSPLGYQEELWWAMQPGVAATAVVREFAQITTSRSLSTTVPFASVRLGDSHGTLLGINISNGPLLAENVPCGPAQVVLHDLYSASDRDASGSLAIAGEPGGGKTATLKKLSSDIIDRDGQLIIIDRTEKGEWADWADSMTKAVVVDTANPQLSLDPLRIFGPRLGSQIMQSFLTPLINVSPTSERGVLLSDVLDPIYMVDHDITSAGALVEHLQEGCTLHGAGDLARLLNVFARRELGQVVFSNNVAALELSSPAVVIRTHKLLLPDRSEIEHAHLFEQLGLEKLFGRALNALVATIAKHVCLADTSQLSGLVVSEAHGITISSEGEDSLATLVRDGRKHRAVVLMDSHDPIADFGSPTLRGLIPGRLLMRQRDKTLAQRGLEWLDLDRADESLVKLIREDTSPLGSDGKTVPVHRRGEGLLRDLNGNLGRIKVLLPARADRRDAITKGGNAAAQKVA